MNYNEMTIAELKKVMTEKELPGRSKLTVKNDMIDALVKFDEEKSKEPVVPKEKSYSDMTVSQLKLILKEKNVAGRSKLFSKEKMIEAIVNHDANPNSEAVVPKKKTKAMTNEDLKKLIEDAVSNIEKSFIQDASSEKWIEIKNTMLNISIKKNIKSKKEETKEENKKEENKEVSEKKPKEKKEKKEKKKPKALPETEVSKAFSTPGKKIRATEIKLTKVTKPPSLSKYKKMKKEELVAIVEERMLLVDKTKPKYDLIAAIASDDIVRNMDFKEDGVVIPDVEVDN
jgi:hypothetical protein